MSDTTEMVRLIRHAADRLAEEAVGGSSLTTSMVASLNAAMGYAEAVLNLVAACMEPESEPAIKALARVRALVVVEGQTYVRVDELLEALDGAEERSR